MEEILKKTCPVCKKEIKSLYQRQLEYNYKQHLESHANEDNENERETKNDKELME